MDINSELYFYNQSIMNNTNFYQIMDQTDNEKMLMYLKLEKEELARMLINANMVIEALVKKNNEVQLPLPYQSYPAWPMTPPNFEPFYPTITCNGTGGDNSPIRGNAGSYAIYSGGRSYGKTYLSNLNLEE